MRNPQKEILARAAERRIIQGQVMGIGNAGAQLQASDLETMSRGLRAVAADASKAAGGFLISVSDLARLLIAMRAHVDRAEAQMWNKDRIANEAAMAGENYAL